MKVTVIKEWAGTRECEKMYYKTGISGGSTSGAPVTIAVVEAARAIDHAPQVFTRHAHVNSD